MDNTKDKGAEEINIMFLFSEKFPSKLISKCPATIFADKRTDKVIGRIKLLINSIITINGISITGVPKGTKWDNICLKLLIHPMRIKHIQHNKEEENEIITWAVEENT